MYLALISRDTVDSRIGAKLGKRANEVRIGNNRIDLHLPLIGDWSSAEASHGAGRAASVSEDLAEHVLEVLRLFGFGCRKQEWS